MNAREEISAGEFVSALRLFSIHNKRLDDDDRKAIEVLVAPIEAMDGIERIERRRIAEFCDKCATEHPEAYRRLAHTFSKSGFLWRLIYLGEELRTIKCPIHKGAMDCSMWVGMTPSCPHGCSGTGWLHAPSAHMEVTTGIGITYGPRAARKTENSTESIAQHIRLDGIHLIESANHVHGFVAQPLDKHPEQMSWRLFLVVMDMLRAPAQAGRRRAVYEVLKSEFGE